METLSRILKQLYCRPYEGGIVVYINKASRHISISYLNIVTRSLFEFFAIIFSTKKQELKCVLQWSNHTHSPRWCNGFHTSNGPQGSRVETRPWRWVLMDDKNPQHAFLRRGKKPEFLWRKILRHVNITWKVWTKYFARSIRHCLHPFLLLATRWLN
jgi:hypothetical protein